MRRVVAIFPQGRVLDALETMRTFAVEGAHAPAVQALVREAAHDQPAERFDARAAFAFVYAKLLERWRFKPDPYGSEVVQSPAVTLEAAGVTGDCDDAATLVASVASACSLRARFVVLSVEHQDGSREALHVYAEVELQPGAFSCADLAERRPLGLCPVVPEATHVERYDVQAVAGQGLGFLDGIFSAIGGIFSSRNQRKAAEEGTKAARETRLGMEAQANALSYQADRELDARRNEAGNALAIARLQAANERKSTEAGERAVATILGFAQRAWPAMVALLALKAVAPVLSGGETRARSTRARKAA